MSIPKGGKFHNCHAYVTELYEKGEWEDGKYQGGEHSIRLVSYQSSVVDYNETTRTITLFPRWEYSVTTIRQVCRFIQECTGTWYGVDDLRMLRKIQQKKGKLDANLYGHTFIFSERYPNG